MPNDWSCLIRGLPFSEQINECFKLPEQAFVKQCFGRQSRYLSNGRDINQ